jgi:hypothetical protein
VVFSERRDKAECEYPISEATVESGRSGTDIAVPAASIAVQGILFGADKNIVDKPR